MLSRETGNDMGGWIWSTGLEFDSPDLEVLDAL